MSWSGLLRGCGNRYQVRPVISEGAHSCAPKRSEGGSSTAVLHDAKNVNGIRTPEGLCPHRPVMHGCFIAGSGP